MSCGKAIPGHGDAPTIPPLSAAKKGAGGFTVTLLIFSTLLAVCGMMMLSEATMGIGVVAFAIWLGVMARISQAGDHYFGH